MFRNDPDRDWERFGAEDPYYSMINTEEYRTRSLDDALVEEVLQTGESTIGHFLEFMEREFASVPRGTALEFGCGVGRLILPLARHYEQVTGIDISPSMLREAARNVERRGLDNVELKSADDTLSQVEEQFDLVLSYLVLQHVPVERGEVIIRTLMSHVRPGGILALHVTTARSTPRWRHAIHILRRNLAPLHFVGNLVSGMHWNEPMMQSHLYDLQRVRACAESAGLGEIKELAVRHTDHIGVMIFARRPGH